MIWLLTCTEKLKSIHKLICRCHILQGPNAIDNAAQYYKRAVWYPLLDSMLSEMDKRFSLQTVGCQ